MAQAARFFHWSPAEAASLTITDLLWWRDQANAMLAREDEARRR